MCAPDHQIRAYMAVQQIPACETGRALLSLLHRVISSFGGELGYDIVGTSITTSLAMHVEAAMQRHAADETTTEADAERFQEEFATLGRALAMAGALILSEAKGIAVTEVTEKLHESAVDMGDKMMNAKTMNFLEQDVPDFVKLTFMAITDPKAKLQELQERLDAGDPDVAPATLEILAKMAAAQDAGEEPAMGLIEGFAAAAATETGEEQLSTDDILDMLKEMESLPTTDDPTDLKE